VKTDAILSKDRKYRYVLSRIWDESKSMVMIIGLNSSTADETENDPTIIRCINFAKSWGYGGIYMLNLFGFRATLPKDMFNAKEPIGKDNDKYIKKYSNICDKVICAWGNNGNYLNRSKEVLSKINNTYYLKLNKTGEPAHPLYLQANLKPIKF
jgi:hypothetical protein